MTTIVGDHKIPPARRDRWFWLLVPAVIVMAVIFIVPIAGLILASFHEMAGPGQVGASYTIANYREFLTDPFYFQVLLRTCWLGLLVVGCCLLIGFPVGYYLARTPSRWRGIALFLVISPLLISAVVRNLGWFPLLSQAGLVNWLLLKAGIISSPLAMVSNFTGVVIGLVHALLPFMILTLTAVIQRIDVDLEEAAASLGAAPWRVFCRIILPLSLPGVVAGSLLVFTMTISAYTTPAILGGNRVLVMATYIAQQFRTVLDYPAGGTAATILLLFALLLTIAALQLRTKDGAAS